MSAYLVIREGSKWSDVFRLTPGRQVSIGRANTNAIVVRDSQCSRQHAEIFQSAGRWVVRDLGSRNGTFIGLKRLTNDHPLTPGEVIRVATMQLEFVQDLARIFVEPGRSSDLGPPPAASPIRGDDRTVVTGSATPETQQVGSISGNGTAAVSGAGGSRFDSRRPGSGQHPEDRDGSGVSDREETITERRDRSRYTETTLRASDTDASELVVSSGSRGNGSSGGGPDLIPKVGRSAQLLCRLAFALAKAPHETAIGDLALDAIFVGTAAEAAAILLAPDTLEVAKDAKLRPPNRDEAGQPRPDRMTVLGSRTVGSYSYRRISAFLGETVLRDGEAVLARNVSGDPLLGSADSQGEFSTTSVIGAPIRRNGQTIGLIHLYTRTPEAILDADDLEFALAVADTVALAIETLTRQRKLRDDLSKTQEEVVQLRERLGVESQLVGSSQVVAAIHDQIARAAPTRATVLIRGESGVGKELVAQAIHATSDRRRGPFVCLNCAALSETLLESELFGHEKGAFTGATDRKVGKFEAADKGTLLLDEVGEMSLAIQAKFLRVLEGHPFERVGGNRAIKVDVRVLAATNRELEQAVRENRFRSDLYFRLRVVEVRIPPLRERRADVIELTQFFLRRFNREMGRRIEGLTDRAKQRLREYDWPGNVRELKNVIERAVVLARSNILDADDLALADFAPPSPPPLVQETIPNGGPHARDPFTPTESRPFGAQAWETRSPGSGGRVPPSAPPVYTPIPLSELERRHILETLDETGGNKSRAAAILGIERSTLDRKLKKYEDDGAN